MSTTVTHRSRTRVEISARIRTAQHGAIQAGLPAGALVTLCAVEKVWVAHPAGLPFPSQTRLAAIVNLSPRTVRRHLAALERAGLLRIFRNPVRRGAGGRFVRRTNRYLILDRVARARNRRSHLGDTPDPSTLKRGAVDPLVLFSPPETAPGPLVERTQIADLRARLRSLRL